MIYLDHAAATPVSEKVLKSMEPYFSDLFFNPSAPYLPAKRVRTDYEDAKNRIAHTIGAKGADLIITSGATESINLAFTAVSPKLSVLILSTEHAAVRNVAKNYNCKEIKVDKNGLIDLKDFQEKLDENVGLVSVSLANNELGTIQPLAEIAEIIRKEHQNRLKNGIKNPIYLHSDASQALNLIDISVARLGVDLLTISAAKIYGPKGIGALYVSHGVKLKPISFGGGQEMGLRSGTENVPLAVGFATAAEEAKKHINGNRKKYQTLKKIFVETLEKELNATMPAGPAGISYKFLFSKRQLDNFIPVCFPGLDAERLIFKLEDKNVYVSTGAACAASKGEKSHVLKAIGMDDEEIAGSLRITLGASNDEALIKEAAYSIAAAVKEELSRK